MRIHPKVIHPLWLRLMHWVNALGVMVLLLSGWRIYNATAFLGFQIPQSLTLGGWLGGALQWHFAAMWVLVGNGVLYLAMNLLQGRFYRKFFPISLAGLWADLRLALTGRLSHAQAHQYNMVQRAAYLFVILDCLVLVISGLVLWKSVQFPMLRTLVGGYESARVVHFVAMAALTGFVLVHITMVALVPKTLLHMVRGY